MKDMKAIPEGTHEIAAWLIIMVLFLFGNRYLKGFIEYILLKLYEFFIEHKQFTAII